ncbi:hypothetical protein Hanom_Chr04g00286541 [Helianthus anomalus]
MLSLVKMYFSGCKLCNFVFNQKLFGCVLLSCAVFFVWYDWLWYSLYYQTRVLNLVIRYLVISMLVFLYRVVDHSTGCVNQLNLLIVYYRYRFVYFGLFTFLWLYFCSTD